MSNVPPASGTQPAGAQTNVVTSRNMSGEGIYIAPVVGSLDLSGGISQETLQLLDVSMEFNDRFDLELDPSESVTLLNSFAVSGAGETFAVDWSDTTGDAFKAIMQQVIEDATCTSSAAQTGTNTPSPVGKKLSEILNDQTIAVFRRYFENTIPNILESLTGPNGWSLTTSVDAAGGADDMRNKLGPGPREIIAQQIPQAAYAAYMDPSENSLITALPLLAGDRLVFIFNTNTALQLDSGNTKTSGTTADTAADATIDNTAAGYGTETQNITYEFSSRKIAFFVRVVGAGQAKDGSPIAGLN